MNNEYIIVNKTLLEKRIEELENDLKDEPNPFINTSYQAELDVLNKVLFKSAPLIPEINAAIEFGKDIIGLNTFINTDENNTPFIDYFDTTTETNHYISNLKLDI